MTPDQANLILAAYADRPVPDRMLDDVLQPAITRRAALHLAQRLIDGGYCKYGVELRELARFIEDERIDHASA